MAIKKRTNRSQWAKIKPPPMRSPAKGAKPGRAEQSPVLHFVHGTGFYNGRFPFLNLHAGSTYTPGCSAYITNVPPEDDLFGMLNNRAMEERQPFTPHLPQHIAASGVAPLHLSATNAYGYRDIPGNAFPQSTTFGKHTVVVPALANSLTIYDHFVQTYVQTGLVRVDESATRDRVDTSHVNFFHYPAADDFPEYWIVTNPERVSWLSHTLHASNLVHPVPDGEDHPNSALYMENEAFRKFTSLTSWLGIQASEQEEEAAAPGEGND